MKSESLQKNIAEIKGVGPKVKEELSKIGINYIQDALFLLPKKYENRTKLTSIKDLVPGEAFQFEGEILESKTIFPGRRSFMARISDGTGFLQIRLFYFSYAQANAFKVGLHVRGYGVVRSNGSLLQVFHPSYKIFESSKRPILDDTLTPIYSLGSTNLTQFRTRNIIKECLKEIEYLNLNEVEIDSIFRKQKISSLSVKDALLKIHNPSVDDDIIKINNYKHEAQERLIVEELATNLIGGERGLLSYFEKKDVERKLSNTEKLLTIKLYDLKKKNRLLSENVDLDYLDIMYREKLKLGKKEEILIKLK